MKRKAETLVETLTAMTVFGIISAVIFGFLANQTLHLARVRDRKHMLFAAQKLISCSSFDVNVTAFKPVADTGVEYTLDDHILTLKKGSSTMSLTVQ